MRAWSGALRGEGVDPEKHNIDASEKLARKAFTACMSSFIAVNRVLHKFSEGAEVRRARRRDRRSWVRKLSAEVVPLLVRFAHAL